MLPEVRVLLERADARRHVIEGLLEAVPEPFWLRTAAADAWSARTHVAHLAAMDTPVAGLLGQAEAGAREAWLFDTRDPAELETTREAALAGFAATSPRDLKAELSNARTAVTAALQTLRSPDLEMDVFVAGATDAWGRQLSWSLRAYLRHWAAHDGVHESAIRRAFETPPDLSAVALTRRLR